MYGRRGGPHTSHAHGGKTTLRGLKNQEDGLERKTGFCLCMRQRQTKIEVLTASSIQTRWERLSSFALWDKRGDLFIQVDSSGALWMIKECVCVLCVHPLSVCQSGLKVVVYRTNMCILESINERCDFPPLLFFFLSPPPHPFCLRPRSSRVHLIAVIKHCSAHSH